VQVLGREAGRFSEAEAWLHGSTAQRLLGGKERERLLGEVRAMQREAEGAPLRPETPSNAPERAPQQQRGGSAGAVTKVQPAAHAPWDAAGAKAAAAQQKQAVSSIAAATGPAPLRPSPPAPGDGAEGAAAAVDQGSPAVAGTAGSSRGAAAAQSSGMPWPAELQQRAAEWWRRAEGWAAVQGVSQGQAAAAALGTALLLYAAFAERRALALGARR
jgi:hypothetical protein